MPSHPEQSSGLEALLIEGIKSGEPTEMTLQDWTDIRNQALIQFESRKSRNKD